MFSFFYFVLWITHGTMYGANGSGYSLFFFVNNTPCWLLTLFFLVVGLLYTSFLPNTSP